jgi:predicted RNA-binding Zn ribbon-like protein
VNTKSTPNHPPRSDHLHGIVPLETAFDFLNTLELEDGALVERLTSYDDAIDWLAGHGVIRDRNTLDQTGRTVDDRAAALTRFVDARTALRDVAHAVAHERSPDAAAIAVVNHTLGARERIQLVAADDGVRLGHTHVGDPIDDVLARIAEPIVREIGAGRDDRIRICANDTCRWIFYDESRAGRRRWCDMATCGNRAKARRHRERRKDTAPDPDFATGSSVSTAS